MDTYRLQRFLSSLTDESSLSSNAKLPAFLKESVDHAVQQALQRRVHGMRDFAFAADGARIVPALTSVDASAQKVNAPDVILRDNLAGGRCFSLGTSGQVGVAIPALIYPSHLTIEHIPKCVAEDIGKAPRSIRWWGAVDGKHNQERYKWYLTTVAGRSASPTAPPLTHGYTFVHLGDFEYDVHGGEYVQTFAMRELVHVSDMYFGVFVVEVLDNWGSSSTCLYRLRIHGQIAAK
ncbi:hypothetical protein L226DRAFT_467353 [Lentinus tigrinus ALCF2SS1-7]|uniref:SUN domain-containing protein n=1 Tax=Lentinus tigrinus ALCF2SS1-6 TaxID=1328759 RepID=A0A5C2S9Y8_9APHY|nr:hypothetical protein L227DRAFT_505848 [Lentinus tigrinus ALCF2SS1-6]RPD72188.1 hypothetical protein L226DRAFT_467353 [Lentinus tigrinus ALCF2SS1-7]